MTRHIGFLKISFELAMFEFFNDNLVKFEQKELIFGGLSICKMERMLETLNMKLV